MVGAASLVLLLSACGNGDPAASESGGVANPPHSPHATSSDSGASPAAMEDGTTVLQLDFDDGVVGETMTPVTSGGTARVSAEVVTTGSGSAVATNVPDGVGLRLPAFAEGRQDFAVVRVLPAGDDTSLDPGSRDFGFGADVLLDDVTGGAPSDNGDNLLQRGLFDDGGQFKIQLDHGRPSCRLAGTDGDLLVTLDQPLGAEEWHRIWCTRTGDELRLSVSAVTPAGLGAERVATASGPLGSIDLAPTTPLSVGGKLAADGQIVVSSSDQLNGIVDRVVVAMVD